MELENVTIAAELSSSDPTKQINALLILHRLYTAGKDIQNYVSTVINAVLVKSTDSLVKKLCYQLIKGCAITSRHDWNFVMKVIVDDITNVNQNPDLCIWAFRTVIGLCGITTQLQEFFVKNRRQIEECVCRVAFDHVRMSALHFIKCLAISLRQSETLRSSTFLQQMNESSTCSLFGNWILKSITSDNQEISFVAFEILREFICGDCKRHFHFEKLPILVTKESLQWITFFKKYFYLLLGRIKCMDIRRRFSALRPITYIALTLTDDIDNDYQNNNEENNQNNNGTTSPNIDNNNLSEQNVIDNGKVVLMNVTNLLKPMLQSIECATVLETCHCILLIALNSNMTTELTACTNNLIDEAINAYLELLNREESSFFYDDLMKDICCVLNTVRDKYTICIRLFENIMKVMNDTNRMYLISNIVKILIQCSVNSRSKQYYLKLIDQLNEPIEIELFLREGFVSKLWSVPESQEEETLRCDLLFCLCREYLSQKPYTPSNNNDYSSDNNNGDAMDVKSNDVIGTIDYSIIHAWLDVGIGICEYCLSAFTWKDSPGTCAAISEFAFVLTDLCNEAYNSFNTNEEQRKRIQKILNKILDIILKMKTEFSELVSMCILSNYVELQKQAAGRESGDLVFDHVRFMITSILRASGGINEKLKIEILIYCLLRVCYRFSPKLRDTYEYLKNLIEKRNTLSKNDEIIDLLKKNLLKVEYAMKYHVTNDINVTNNNNMKDNLELIYGKVFNRDHPIFKSYYNEADQYLLNCYIEGLQLLNIINNNLHESDLYQLKNNKQMLSNTIKNLRIKQENQSEHYKYYSEIISNPSDPISVTASYSVIPDSYTVYLHVKVQNHSPTDLFRTTVEVGLEGSLTLFEKTQQATTMIGDLPLNQSYEFDLEFTMNEFSHYSFHILIHCTHIKSISGGIDLLEDKKQKLNELVTIRCKPFQIKTCHVLNNPVHLLHKDFLTLWENYDNSFHLKVVIPKEEPKRINENEISSVHLAKELISKMLHYLHFIEIKQLDESIKLKDNIFQLCYSSKTLFKDNILLIVFGYEHFDDNHYLCDFQFKASSERVYNYLHSKNLWFQEMIDETCKSLNKNIFLCENDSHNKEYYDITTQSIFDKVKVNVVKKYQLNSTKLNVLYLKRWDTNRFV
ncbi:hypothetical protein ABK040_003017 [Willaertia magna]